MASKMAQLMAMKKELDFLKGVIQLMKENEEYEAVEKCIVNKIKAGGKYDDILKAHYREGKLNDKGEWEDEEEDESDEEVCEDCGEEENGEFRVHETEAWLCKKCYEKRDKYPNADDYDCASDDDD